MEKVITSYDEGLRNFMLNMYNHTSAGLALSGLIAYFVYATGLISTLMTGPLGLFFIFAPLGMILVYSFLGQNWNLSTVTLFYYVFVSLMGVSLSTIFAVYTSASIAQVFLITAATFAAASLYGYTTHKDLTSIGSFLLIGLIGIIIAMIVNIFLASPAIMFAISIIGVIIFVGLTAYDTQAAKGVYLSSRRTNPEDAAKYGIIFALSLYLNFINLFQMLLSLLGQRQE
jgi:FtsH-binding integral membrane protein